MFKMVSIFIVEDEPSLQLIYKNMFDYLGFQVVDIASNGRDAVKKFESLFADFTKISYAKAVSNCTTALHLALDALGVGVGDKVVVPSFTYIASANAVEYTGAEVVFCDINMRTFNIDVNKLEPILENDKNIKVVMPVNLFGLCADMPEIMRLAKKYN
ncbi:hypothetical protein LCGC14_1191990, partial [marine sediment metagenome]